MIVSLNVDGNDEDDDNGDRVVGIYMYILQVLFTFIKLEFYL